MTDNDKDIPLWALDKAAQVAGRKDWEEFKKYCLVSSTYRYVETLAAIIAERRAQAKVMDVLSNPSDDLLNKAADAANGFCEIDGDSGAWITSDGIREILSVALTEILAVGDE